MFFHHIYLKYIIIVFRIFINFLNKTTGQTWQVKVDKFLYFGTERAPARSPPAGIGRFLRAAAAETSRSVASSPRHANDDDASGRCVSAPACPNCKLHTHDTPPRAHATPLRAPHAQERNVTHTKSGFPRRTPSRLLPCEILGFRLAFYSGRRKSADALPATHWHTGWRDRENRRHSAALAGNGRQSFPVPRPAGAPFLARRCNVQQEARTHGYRAPGACRARPREG
jgi:hypothetical protein